MRIKKLKFDRNNGRWNSSIKLLKDRGLIGNNNAQHFTQAMEEQTYTTNSILRVSCWDSAENCFNCIPWKRRGLSRDWDSHSWGESASCPNLALNESQIELHHTQKKLKHTVWQVSLATARLWDRRHHYSESTRAESQVSVQYRRSPARHRQSHHLYLRSYHDSASALEGKLTF